MNTENNDNRAHRRLDLQLITEFQHERTSRTTTWRTVTQNVSTGGAYFKTTLDDITVGDKLSLAFSMDPDDQRFAPNGQITTVAEVVRVETILDEHPAISPDITRYGIGVKFSQPLKLSF